MMNNNYGAPMSAVEEACAHLNQWRIQQLEGGRGSSRDEADFVEEAVYRLFDQPRLINLLAITPYASPTDFDVIRNFLSPYGFLFKLVLQLDGDANIRFDASGSPRRRATSWDIQSASQRRDDQSTLLGCLEHFLLHFARHLQQAAAPSAAGLSDCATDSVYLALLQDYVVFFLPVQLPFPAASLLTSVAPVVERHRPAADQRSTVHHSRTVVSPLGLFKRNLFKSHAGSASHESDGQPLMAKRDAAEPTSNAQVLWKTWTFVRSLVDVWTSVDSAADASFKFRSSTPPANNVSAPTSLVLVTALRFLLKQVHVFLWTPTPVGNHALAEMKQLLLGRLVQAPLFVFLVHLFDNWPLDASFRHILETWLTYIQPWRYAPGYAEERDPDWRRWQSFVEEHLRFYTILLRKVATRFLRLDLTSYKNVLMVNRVVKVFSNQPGLVDLIDSLSTRDEPAGTAYGRLVQSPATLFGDSQVYDESRERLAYFCDLLLHVETACADVRERLKAERAADEERRRHLKQSRSWLQALFASDPPNLLLGDLERLIDGLSQTITYLTTAFRLERPSLDRLNATRRDYQSDWSFGRQLQGGRPDCFVDENTGLLRLTDTGRQQVMRNCRRFDFDNADTVIPARVSSLKTTEWAFLARLLHSLTMWLNRTRPVGALADSYSSPSVGGRFARRLLDSPSPDPRLHGQVPAVRRTLPRLAPGVSLRWLAEYRTLFCVCLALLVGRFLFGFDPVVLLVSVVVAYIVWNGVMACVSRS
uniref:Sphingomyelin phosphodiesterase 4 n=1 Tax=Plectus sambesii TaxID=2011161 RepID=A0A914WXR0_9BILA